MIPPFIFSLAHLTSVLFLIVPSTSSFLACYLYRVVCDRLKLRFELAPDLPTKLQPTEAELRIDAELARADELRAEKLHKLRLELAAQRDRFVKQRERTLGLLSDSYYSIIPSFPVSTCRMWCALRVQRSSSAS